jgi:hypothetical protein
MRALLPGNVRKTKMQRITAKFLRAQISNLNSATGHTDEIYRVDETGRVIGGNPGTYCLSGAYGGWALHQMSAGGGTGVCDVFSSGHMPARELSDRISAFSRGMKAVTA